MMITFAGAGPQRLMRVFKKPTTIQIQVKHATAKFFFCNDQGEAANSGGANFDGMILMASNTNPTSANTAATPYNYIAQGEVWFTCDTAGASFVANFVEGVTQGG